MKYDTCTTGDAHRRDSSIEMPLPGFVLFGDDRRLKPGLAAHLQSAACRPHMVELRLQGRLRVPKGLEPPAVQS